MKTVGVAFYSHEIFEKVVIYVTTFSKILKNRVTDG